MPGRLKVLAAGLLAYLAVFFQRTALTVVQPDLQQAFTLSAVDFSNLASLYFYVYALLQIPAGLLADSLGPRKVIAGGMLLAAGGSALFALAPGLPALYVGRLLTAAAMAPIFVCVLKLNGSWARPGEFGTLTGIAVAVGHSGALLSTWPLDLAATAFGWRGAFGLVAGGTLLLGALAWALVRDRPATLATDLRAPALSWRETWRGLGQTLRKGEIYFPTLVFLGAMAPLMTLQAAWGARLSVTLLGVERSVASVAVMGISIGHMAGALLVGKLSDLLGGMRVMVTMLGFFVLAWVLLLTLPASWWNLPALCLWMGGMGFFATGFTPAWGFGKEIAGARFSGIGMAIVNGGGFLGAGILQPLYGTLLDRAAPGGSPTLAAFAMANRLLLGAAGLSLALAVSYLLLRPRLQAARRWRSGEA